MNKAIEKKPNDAQLHDVLGRIYENKKDLPKARECFEKAIALDPNYVDAIGNLGRLIFNKAVEEQAAANDIADNKKYNAEIAKVKEVFKQAMPYFEKAHQLNPTEKSYIMALRGIYYNLNMNDKYDAMEKKMEELNK